MSIECGKSFRLLKMFEKLNRGEVINKKEFADYFGISEKSVQRDIDDLRTYLAEAYGSGDEITVKYSYLKNGYSLVKKDREFLTNQEILTVCKILLESRAFNREELDILTNKLLMQATQDAKVNINELILNEKFHYIPPRHKKPLIEAIWEISDYIHKKEIIEFDYKRQDGKVTHRTVKPLNVMFSEYYFYLIAWFADNSKDYPAVFRADRITNLKSKGESFRIPYAKRFEDGEFRKRVQFMYSGPLKRVRFEFSGPSLEAILDRLPTAKVLECNNGVYILEAESYGDGILMWLRTQGDNVKIINF